MRGRRHSLEEMGSCVAVVHIARDPIVCTIIENSDREKDSKNGVH